MNKRIFTLLLAALLLLTASSCSKKQALPEQKTADILATTQPVYQLASALTDGTGLSASLLISEPVSCLHDYTLTVAQMEKIEGAQLVWRAASAWRISWRTRSPARRASISQAGSPR